MAERSSDGLPAIQAAEELDGVHTELALVTFADSLLAIVTQLGRPGTMVRVETAIGEGNQPIFHTTPLMAARDELGLDVCVKHVAKALFETKMLRPGRELVLSLGLKKFEAAEVKAVAGFVKRAVAQAASA